MNVSEQFSGKAGLYLSTPVERRELPDDETKTNFWHRLLGDRFLPRVVALKRPLLVGKGLWIAVAVWNALSTLTPLLNIVVYYSNRPPFIVTLIFCLFINYIIVRLPYILMDFGYLTIVGSTKDVSDIYYTRQLSEFKAFCYTRQRERCF